MVAALATSVSFAEDRYPTFTNPEAAGRDFQIQGEYVGHVGKVVPIGVQVIALGGGQFDGVVYRGGLPGAGWDGSPSSYFVGKTDGRVTALDGHWGYQLEEKNPFWQATIQDGIIRGHDLSYRNLVEDVSFELHKVQRTSSTMGAKPPPGAIVLFDGTDTNAWVEGQIVEKGLLRSGAITRRSFKDHRLHLEFRTPFMPTARGMYRGNSGVFLRNRMEIQIVDSFGWTRINRRFVRNSWVGRCGGIAEFIPPRVNMSFPPLSWQTYDIEYTAARWDEQGQELSPALVTVRQNGVMIHNRQVLPSESTVKADRELGPLYLQAHHDRVVYRNIWVETTQSFKGSGHIGG